MSDDTPTQRFRQPEDSPTERIGTTEVSGELREERQKSRGLLIGLIVAGGLLLVAIVVLIVFLLTQNASGGEGMDAAPTPSTPVSGSPSAVPSDTATPDPTPTASTEPDTPDAPPPPPTGAAFTTFSPTTQVSCSRGGPGFTPDPPSIQISWATVRSDSAWIVQGTSDAANAQFMQIPLNGNQSDFPYTLQFPCFQANATYTITLVGTDGQHLSKSWTVANIGDKD